MNTQFSEAGDDQHGTSVPASLYKYRSLDGGALRLTTSLTDSLLYFAAPLSFNDPFDCRAPYHFEGTPQEIERYFLRIGEKYLADMPPSQRQDFIERRTRAFFEDPGVAREVQEMHYQKVTSQTGVLCLTTKCDDILMWSHYAGGHTGVCLEFDARTDFFARAIPVTYSEIRPALNPFRQSNEEMLDAAMLTKAYRWQYENEWRIIEYGRAPGPYMYPSEALTGVILGARISNPDAEKIGAFIAKNRPRTKLYRSVVDEGTYSIRIEEICG